MTERQIILMAAFYLLELGAVIYFARPTIRRSIGALAGGAVVGLMMLGAIALGNIQGWWQVPFASTPFFLPLLYLASAISCAPIYLVTWRVARRFGGRGLAVSTGIVAVVGPARDYWIAATFPQWMVFAPGILPILADSATYVGILLLGHAVMRLVAGPALEDQLARRSREAP
ncbi:MAG: hypothetical protein ABJB33_08120 [Gemmatimonadota bacterium]